MKLPRPILIFIVAVISLANSACAQETTQELTWQTFPEAADNARISGKQMLVFVYTDTCPWCNRLLDSTYTDPQVISYINQNFELARVDAQGVEKFMYEEMEMNEGQLAAALKAQGYPTHIFMKNGAEKLTYLQQVPGYRDSEEFLTIIRYFGENAYESQTYQEFVES